MTGILPTENRRRWFVLALAVLVLDQATKVLVHAWLAAHPPVTVVPNLLNLAYSRNRGGLFGYFGEVGDPWRSILLTLLPLLAVLLVSIFIARGRDMDRPSLAGLGLILGGAVGNLVDRVVRGEVVDFLDLYVAWTPMADRLRGWFGTNHWPTFNLADTAIVIGALTLAFSISRTPARRPEEAGAEPRR
jgi:signal peptidase II